MNGWLTQNLDYAAFLALVAGLWLGLALWLRRTGRRGARPPAAGLLLLAQLAGGGVMVAQAGRNAQKNIRRQLELLLPFYVQEIQQLGHARLPDNPAPDDALYLRLIRAEIRWLKHNPAIADIYTFRRRADGVVFLLVDSETDYDHNGVYEGAREQRTKPGEVYPNVTPGLERAFRGEQVFEEEPMTDRWGTWISAFAPLRDANGQVEGVLGVDFDAAEWLAQRTEARRAQLWLLGGLVAALTGAAVVIALLRHELEDRRKTERQLREQGELRRMIFDQAPGGIMVGSLDHHLVKVNDAFCRMLGYTREELLRLTFPQICHPDDPDNTVHGQPTRAW